jgi:hypothetical protein
MELRQHFYLRINQHFAVRKTATKLAQACFELSSLCRKPPLRTLTVLIISACCVTAELVTADCQDIAVSDYNYQHRLHRTANFIACWANGVPRNFFSGGFNKFSWRQGAQRTGLWGRWPLKADSHIPCRSHAVPMPFPYHDVLVSR